MARVDDIDEVVLAVTELASALRDRHARGERTDPEKIQSLREVADRLHATARLLSDGRIQGPMRVWPASEAFVLASTETMDRRDPPTLRIRPLRDL